MYRPAVLDKSEVFTTQPRLFPHILNEPIGHHTQKFPVYCSACIVVNRTAQPRARALCGRLIPAPAQPVRAVLHEETMKDPQFQR